MPMPDAPRPARETLAAGCATTVLAVLALLPATALAARAYVSNEDGETVSIIDTDKGDVLATIDVGKRPRGIKVSRDGAHLYVAVSGLPKCPPSVPDEECAKRKRDLAADGIAVIDTHAAKLIKVLPSGSDPEQFDLSADGHRLFISNEDKASLSVVNVATGSIEATIAVGHEPEGVRVTPNGKWVVVTSESDNVITLIDTKTLEVSKSIAVGKRPRDVAFTPDSKAAYVSGEFDASVYRAALSQPDAVTRVLQLQPQDRPMGLVLDAERNRLYVSTGRGGTVVVIDVATCKLVREIAVGARPWGIALSHDGRHLYTANGPSNDVSVIDTGTLQVVKRIAVGKGPWGIVLAR